jgi:hypothetical protein
MTKQTKRMARRWTTEEIDTLRTMYHAGIRHKEIARILNRSVGAVQQRAHAEGLTADSVRKRYVSEPLTTYDEVEDADEISSDVAPNKPWWKRLLGIGG